MEDLEALGQDLVGVLLLLRAVEPYFGDAAPEVRRWYELALCTAEGSVRQVRAMIEERHG